MKKSILSLIVLSSLTTISYAAVTFTNGTGTDSIAITSTTATVNGTGSIGIGNGVLTGTTGTDSGDNSVAIGTKASTIQGTAGSDNQVAIGNESTAAGSSSVSIGYQVGQGSSGYYNFALGSESGQNLTGDENISLGRWANNNNTTSGQNIAIGLSALNGATDLQNAPTVISSVYASGGNTAIGSSALASLEGSSNVAIGTRAGYNLTGSGNVLLGTLAGQDAGASTPLSNSIIMGTQSGNGTGGDKNVIIGNFENNQVVANNVVVVGSNSTVTQQFGLGLGHGITNNAKYGLAVGSYSVLTSTATKSGIFGTGTGTGASATTVSGASTYAIGNSNNVSANKAFVLGNNVTTTADNSVFLGDSSAYVSEGDTTKGLSTSYTSADINGLEYDYAGGNINSGVVSVGSMSQTRRIQNVAPGYIAATSTDAVNGSQLYATNNVISNMATSIKNIIGGNTVVNSDGTITAGLTYNNATYSSVQEILNNITGNTTSGSNTVTVNTGSDNTNNVVSNGDTVAIKAGNNITITSDGNNNVTIATVDNPAYTSITSDTLTTNSLTSNSITSNTYNVGNKTYIDSNGINANSQKIINVADGSVSPNSTDAVNGGQLYEVSHNVDKLSNRLDKVGAGASALSGLHPLDFDPDNKFNVAVAGGFYRGEQALAIGAFYHPNEETMFSISSTVGNNDNMVNIGASFKVGQTTEHKFKEQYKTAPISTVYVLEQQVTSQKNIIELQNQKINDLEDKVNKLTELVTKISK